MDNKYLEQIMVLEQRVKLLEDMLKYYEQLLFDEK